MLGRAAGGRCLMAVSCDQPVTPMCAPVIPPPATCEPVPVTASASTSLIAPPRVSAAGIYVGHSTGGGAHDPPGVEQP